MPTVHNAVSRQTQTNTIARGDVKPGQAFRVQLKAGLGKNTYGALGTNGKNLSINLATGELASTKSDSKRVVVVGKFSIKTNVGSDVRAASRGALSNSAIFRVKGKDQLYFNLGKITSTGRYVSLNAGKPFSEDYAATSNGGKNVEQVGTWSVEATLVR